MKQNLIIVKSIFVILFLFILVFPTMSCIQQGSIVPFSGNTTQSLPPISTDDPCADTLRQLVAYNKKNMAKKEIFNFTSCLISCTLDGFLNKKLNMDACSSKCSRKFDSNTLVSSFIKTSDQDNKWFRAVNQQIDQLQACRNKEIERILSDLKKAKRTKDVFLQQMVKASYDNFKQKIKNDNIILDSIVSNSQKKIAAKDKVAKKLDILTDDFPRLQVRSGYNVRNAPNLNGGKIGKTRGGEIAVQEIEGSWVKVIYNLNTTAYVHKKAFPSITPQVRKKVKAQASYAVTKQSHKDTESKTKDYKDDLNDQLAILDAMIASS